MPVNDELFKRAMTAVGATGKKDDDKTLASDLEASLGDQASDQEAQRQFTPEEEESIRRMITPGAGPAAQPMWAPFERRQFTRLGLSPERLNFLQTLAGLRKGMNLESELLDKALRGRVGEFEDVEELPLGQYA